MILRVRGAAVVRGEAPAILVPVTSECSDHGRVRLRTFPDNAPKGHRSAHDRAGGTGLLSILLG